LGTRGATGCISGDKKVAPNRFPSPLKSKNNIKVDIYRYFIIFLITGTLEDWRDRSFQTEAQ
jgi:hypothetical protein